MDGLGNWTSHEKSGSAVTDFGPVTNAVNNLSQYTSFEDEDADPTLDYDFLGNLIKEGSKTYRFDAFNRLIEFKEGGISTLYKYDAFGRRIWVKHSYGEFWYIYDGDRVIEEYQLPSFILFRQRYIHGRGIDEIVLMEKDTGFDGIPDSDYYYHTDALGSFVALTEENGNVVTRYRYDPNGNDPQNSSAPQQMISPHNNLYLFTGRRYDMESELYYYRARYFSPRLGRFLQRDPVGYADGMNPYQYVRGNPTNFVDPSGLRRVHSSIAGIARLHSQRQPMGKRSGPSGGSSLNSTHAQRFARYQNPGRNINKGTMLPEFRGLGSAHDRAKINFAKLQEKLAQNNKESKTKVESEHFFGDPEEILNQHNANQSNTTGKSEGTSQDGDSNEEVLAVYSEGKKILSLKATSSVTEEEIIESKQALIKVLETNRGRDYVNKLTERTTPLDVYLTSNKINRYWEKQDYIEISPSFTKQTLIPVITWTGIQNIPSTLTRAFAHELGHATYKYYHLPFVRSQFDPSVWLNENRIMWELGEPLRAYY
jgi:RHS repeat-associated protein